MGQQQLLLIILGIIIIGVAIVVSVSLFRTNAINHKRDLVTNECISLASMAIDHYKKPKIFGGGEKSFTGWKIPAVMIQTATGNFQAEVFDNRVEITGTGNDLVTDRDSVKVKVTVLPGEFRVLVIN